MTIKNALTKYKRSPILNCNFLNEELTGSFYQETSILYVKRRKTEINIPIIISDELGGLLLSADLIIIEEQKLHQTHIIL